MLEGQSPKASARETFGQRAVRWARDPTLRFFAIGALLFVVHRVAAGDPRVIVVTPGVRADLERRFRDHRGREPSPAELEQELSAWKRDEALYREALHDGLDRDDPTLRSVLADKVRARAAFETKRPEPSQAELDAWLAAHRDLYEIPRRFDYEFVEFPKADATSAAARDEYERALQAGKDARGLGRPILGGKLKLEELKARLGVALADRIATLPPGRWERFENDSQLVLVRVKAVEGGGLPDADELRLRTSADLLAADQKQAVERAVEAIVLSYRFEERK